MTTQRKVVAASAIGLATAILVFGLPATALAASWNWYNGQAVVNTWENVNSALQYSGESVSLNGAGLTVFLKDNSIGTTTAAGYVAWSFSLRTLHGGCKWNIQPVTPGSTGHLTCKATY